MDARDPRVTSFDALASLCLANGNWPAGIQPKARSLAALFSKFDRGIEVEWLDDRAQAQVALAKVLSCQLGVLQSELRKHVHVIDVKVRRYRLPEAPFAQLLDLLETRLPPGLPPLLATPDRWDAHWWPSDVGDGGDLVKRWLVARDLARVATCQSWAEARPHWEAPGPLLLELPRPLADGHHIPPRAGLCVRASSTPGAGFKALSVEPIAAHLPELMSWLSSFLGSEGWFTPGQALVWMKDADDAGLVDSFDAAIGLGAVFHEFGWESLRGRSFAELAGQWLDRRFAEGESRQASDEAWPPARTFELLRGMALRSLAEESQAWHQPRTLEQWSELVPEDIQRELDTRAARASLSRASAKLTVDELTGALRRGRPEGSAALRGLLGIRSLDPIGADCYRLTPRWVANVALSAALGQLAHSDATTWGEALLAPPSQRRVRQLLLGHLRTGERGLLERLLERGSDANPAAVMAMETMGELTGEALLYGSEFNEEALKGLFLLQLSTLATSPHGVVSPRLLCSPDDALGYASWQLAWWTIAERVSPEPTPCPSTLDPWGAEAAPDARCLDRIQSLLEHREFDEYVVQAYALVGRLFQNEPAKVRTHALLLPAQINRQSDWSAWLRLSKLPHGVQAAHGLAVTSAWPEIATGAWDRWLAADLDATGELLFSPTSACSQVLWPHVPPRVLLELINHKPEFCADLPWHTLKPEHHGAALNGDWPQLPACVLQVLEHISEELLPLASRWASRDGGEIAARLWRRFPDRSLEVGLSELRAGNGEEAFSLLAAAPEQQRQTATSAIIAALERMRHSDPLRPWMAECLHRYVTHRGAGWKDAYAAYLTLQGETRT
jgi:hypothetical protein